MMDYYENLKCPTCCYVAEKPNAKDLGKIRGNTERFCRIEFPLWKCPECLTIMSIEPMDLQDIYSDYPLNKRQLDIFARGTLKNLLRRLTLAGMKKTDTILDYGCGNGIFVDYLKQQGYTHVVGYDPYVPEYEKLPAEGIFDVVVNNDVLEHCDDNYAMIEESLLLLKPEGLLYIGTADSTPVDMQDLEPHVLRLHQPFHRIILTEKALHKMIDQYAVTRVTSYQRSYHDTLRPFSNYRFLDELNGAVGHNLDNAMDEKATNRAFLRTPRLWFFAFFGYWFPTAIEPAVIVRKNK